MSRTRAAKEPASLPTGTVTFLFSDIEGSTQRWERHREAMKAAVRRHELLLTDALEKNRGYIFKSLGDAFCVAFPSAVDAAHAAIAAQRALIKEDFASVDGLRVRMALHTGHAEERSGDYFGPPVNRAARLMSIGHGGQVLLSGVTRDLIHDDLPNDVTLSDLGSRRLKDLAAPEHVWQLTVADLPAAFPPLKSLDDLPNNLPIQPTSFRGRERDLEEVKSLLERHRLLTLTGAGGVGKTRLALQIGADLLDRFPDGVWFADISPITDPELVSSIIASALGIAQMPAQRVDEAIPEWLKSKQLLLIIDNCEHLLEPVAMLVDRTYRRAPNVRILTTSRQALGVAGEAVHRLPSLAVPSTASDMCAADALQYGAIAVFVDRATLADSRFVLNEDNLPIVAEICRHLDGIPLAIELAAARVKVLSIPHLAQRLNDRFKILTGGNRTSLPRQKTLAALIDWSYDLLTPQEQMFFERLGIFAGGFNLEAASAICAGDGIDTTDVLDLLSSLADKSLVVADTSGEIERYHLLESMRAYALEKLSRAGLRQIFARRHAQRFRDEALAADLSYSKGSSTRWLANIDMELDNYRAALEWSLTHYNDAVIGATIAGSLAQFWFRFGLAAEGQYWIEASLDRVNEKEVPLIAARAWHAIGFLSDGKRGYERCQRAISLYECGGDAKGVARAQRDAGFCLLQMGRLDEAREVTLLALGTLRRFDEKRDIASCFRQLGNIESELGNRHAARDSLAQSVAIYNDRAVGDEFGACIVLVGLAELEFADGNPKEAIRSVSAALAACPRTDVRTLAICNINRAAYAFELGDLQQAHEAARQGLQWSRQIREPQYCAIALQHLALALALHGRVANAAQLVGYVDARYHQLGIVRESTEKKGYDELLSILRENLSGAEIEKLTVAGAAWSEDQAVEEALKFPQ